ncbi:hypothetical protein GSI_08045 [Ganoderma sinense ZZ0214-1]|uniref:Uncharacterized protein n=1 Tax=Ganoderma sinense ZZ0214-1 TaxID=1077348 RepID=A0A2G8S8I1_9APHY|nr:hypothetical protein GSI_08045 [Ganoderma sinense ZZ0214-1]
MSSTSESQAVNILSQGEILARLAHLRACFDTLPLTLSDTTYSFQQLELSDEDIEDRGCVRALNHCLECTFCPQGHANGSFLLNGRGPGLLSLVDVLSAFIVDFPGDAILQKWVEDLIRAAEHTSSTTGPVGGSTVSSGVGGSTKKRGRPAGMVTEGQASKKAKSDAAVPRTREVDCPGTSVLSLYDNAQKPPPKGPGGRGVCPLLDKVSIYCHRKRDGELLYRLSLLLGTKAES